MEFIIQNLLTRYTKYIIKYYIINMIYLIFSKITKERLLCSKKKKKKIVTTAFGRMEVEPNARIVKFVDQCNIQTLFNYRMFKHLIYWQLLIQISLVLRIFYYFLENLNLLFNI